MRCLLTGNRERARRPASRRDRTAGGIRRASLTDRTNASGNLLPLRFGHDHAMTGAGRTTDRSLSWNGQGWIAGSRSAARARNAGPGSKAATQARPAKARGSSIGSMRETSQRGTNALLLVIAQCLSHEGCGSGPRRCCQHLRGPIWFAAPDCPEAMAGYCGPGQKRQARKSRKENKAGTRLTAGSRPGLEGSGSAADPELIDRCLPPRMPSRSGSATNWRGPHAIMRAAPSLAACWQRSRRHRAWRWPASRRRQRTGNPPCRTRGRCATNGVSRRTTPPQAGLGS